MDTPRVANSAAVRKPKQLFGNENLDPDPSPTASELLTDMDTDVDNDHGEVVIERLSLLQQVDNLMSGSARGLYTYLYVYF
jgi:hypothetical protein